MIYSDQLFEKSAQDKLMEGVEVMARAVSTTLGPTGRNVAIQQTSPYGEAFDRVVIHDGVTVAKHIYLHDEFANMGAQLLKQAAQKQVQDVGDGTTVSIILAAAMLSQIQQLMAAGVNPMLLRKGLESHIDLLIKEIKTHALPIKTFEQKKHIATVSAEDDLLGELVAKVIEEMGQTGLVTVEESKNADTTVEKQEGMQLDKGFSHQLFQTNPDKGEAAFDSPMFFITDKPMTSLLPVKHLLEYANEHGKKLVFISPSFTPDALGALLENKLRGAILTLAIKAPSFGNNQKNILQDLAIFTGGKYITEDAGHRFEDIKPEDLGKADYIAATKSDTVIVGGKGTKEDIQLRIDEITQGIEKEDVEFDREKMKERLAKLTSGVSVIKVGGATEVEMRERVERVKDAVSATKAAITDGIVPGGEVIYLTIREALPKDKSDLPAQILYKALYEPFKKLLSNAGLNDGQYYEKLSQTEDVFGVHVVKEEVLDMVKEGIIDPAAVPINALLNASSVAIQLATTGAIIIEKVDNSVEPIRR